MSSQSAVTSAGNRGVLHEMAINRLLSPTSSSNMEDLSSKVGNANTAHGAMHNWLVTTSAPGSKRPHTAMNDELDRTDPDSIILPGEEEGDITYDINCDQIRRKIRALIDSGEVKVTHWQRDLGINSNSYGRFMKLKGPWSGMDNQTYQAGYLYFKKRELAGIKPPNVNKKRKSGDGAKPKGPPDTTDIELPGEEEDKVEVFDSCDEIRRKISAHLKKDAVTQASFLRVLAAQFRTSDRKLQSKQLNDFRTKKGADHGNTSAIFYSAYVYFEKLRIKEGKPKSKHRLEMEEVWSHKGGLNTSRPGSTSRGCWLAEGESMKLNSCGRIQISGRPNRTIRP